MSDRDRQIEERRERAREAASKAVAVGGRWDHPQVVAKRCVEAYERELGAAVPSAVTDEHLREALLAAADDLDKAANQFQGLYDGILRQYVQSGQVPGANVRRFAEKAARAREVADVQPTGEER